MTSESSRWSHDKVISSDTQHGIQLITDVVESLRQASWDETELFGIHLAVEEAVMNAIKHGNDSDPNKTVNVSYALQEDEFTIRITDQGTGFSREDVPDPTDDENLDKPSGRGLMLMEYYMSHVTYNEVGNSVVMSKRRGDQPSLEDVTDPDAEV